MVKSEKFQITSRGFNDCIDLTRKIRDILKGLNCTGDCTAHIFAPSLCAIFILPDGFGDEFLNDIRCPKSPARDFIKASGSNSSVTLAVIGGGVVQKGRIVLVDFENRACTKEIAVQVLE